MTTKETGPSTASLGFASSCLKVGFAVGLTMSIELFAAFEKACKGLASTSCTTFANTCWTAVIARKVHPWWGGADQKDSWCHSSKETSCLPSYSESWLVCYFKQIELAMCCCCCPLVKHCWPEWLNARAEYCFRLAGTLLATNLST